MPTQPTEPATSLWEIRATDPDRARLLAEQAAGNPLSILTLAWLDQRYSRHDQAEEGALRALGLFESADDLVGQGRALNILGNVQTSRGRFDEGSELFRRSLAVARRIGDNEGIASSLNNLGVVTFNQGDYSGSLELHLQALQLREAIGSPEPIAQSLHNIGNVYLATGEASQALEYYLRSLGIREQINDLFGQAMAFNNIGTIYTDIGEFGEALEYHHRGLAIRERIGDLGGVATALHNISNVYYGLDDYTRALEFAERSLAIRKQTGDRFGEGRALQNIGSIYLCLGDRTAALEHYNTASDIQRQIGDRHGEGATSAKRGTLHLENGDLALAEQDFRAALAVSEEVGDPGGVAEALYYLGEAAASDSRPQEAVELMERALAIAREIGRRPMQAMMLASLADASQKNEDFEAALRYLRDARQLEKELYGAESQEKVKNLRIAAEIAASRREAELARSNAELERLRNVELKQALDELKAAQTQLVQAEKMASLGQLTAGIAHEINNPINYVSASVKPLRRDFAWLFDAVTKFSELAREHGAGSEDIEDLEEEYDLDFLREESELLFNGIESGASRIAEIIVGLRNFSRLDENVRKKVDLHEGLDATLTLLAATSDDSITIVKQYGELPPVDCYPGEINQVFMIILANAIKALAGSPGTITIGTSEQDGFANISVSDTGSGMSPEVMARVFEPFFTTRDVGEGRGLGLSIAWGIVEKHGGTITVASQPGVGSEFVVSLPVQMQS